MSKNVRVRIAPSPTGDPHVGTAYIALFNKVFAEKFNGKFVLRIEDTDQARRVESSEKQIMEGLNWLGLNWDEGPDLGGEYGPYRQSERKEIYQEHVKILLENKKAYKCFCTSERLANLRSEQKKAKASFLGYDQKCLALTDEEINSKIKLDEKYVVRLMMPKTGTTSFEDELRGKVEINNSQLDDQVILKSDGLPTYHLANVVDDYLMKISHVIRAEEWISSTPKHVLLYDFFGWPQPKWIHMPLLRNTDKSKISKRKNPVSIMYYKRAGILPNAMLNFLGLMGWSFSEKEEKFNLEQMIKKFELKQVSLGGPVFDIKKLNWLNQMYLKELSSSDFDGFVRDQLFSKDYISQIRPLLIERIERFDQFVNAGSFFFNGALNYQGLSIIAKGKDKVQMRKMFKGLAEVLDQVHNWDKDGINEALKSYMKEIEWKGKEFFMPIRLAVTGRPDSPPLVDTMAVLGRDIVRFRVRDIANFLK